MVDETADDKAGGQAPPPWTAARASAPSLPPLIFRSALAIFPSHFTQPEGEPSMSNDFRDPGAYITQGPQDWQVFQRGADGTAAVRLAGVWTPDPALKPEPACTVEARVVLEDTARPPCAACDWRDAAAAGHHAWEVTLDGIPAGGLYRIETRLRQGADPWRLTGDRVFHAAVGDLWAIAGQSNAAGYGRGAADDPISLGVHIYAADLRWKLAAHPLHDTTRTAHPVNRDAGCIDHTPWLSFARQIYDTTGVPIGLLPVALGGSPLSAWDPGEASPALYTNMMEVIRQAGGMIAGMVWYQGESDAGPELAPSYAARFRRFVEGLRRDLRSPGLPVLTAQINRVDGNFVPLRDRFWGMVREAQRQVARSIPGVAVLPTLDLPLSDLVHTSAAGNMVLAERFARAALAMVYAMPNDYKAPDIARATPSADRLTVTLEFDNVRGWLTPHQSPIAEFIVEDADGEVPLAETAASGSTVALKLARPPKGSARVHGALSPNPQIGLRDEDQRPILGFCDVPLQSA